MRGLETFSQLVFIGDDHRVNKSSCLQKISFLKLFFLYLKKLGIKNSVTIKDSPRFPYRGILLDTARHFIPVPVLKKQIDAMSYNKFNVLHWFVFFGNQWVFILLNWIKKFKAHCRWSIVPVRESEVSWIDKKCLIFFPKLRFNYNNA